MVFVSACELTPEEQAALMQGISEGLSEASYDLAYGPGYGSGYGSGYGGGYGPAYGGVSARTVRLCVARGNGRGQVIAAQIRSGHALNRAVGGGVYRTDRNYVSIPTGYGVALVSIPAWASFAEGPVWGTDQQGATWRLSAAYGCA